MAHTVTLYASGINHSLNVLMYSKYSYSASTQEAGVQNTQSTRGGDFIDDTVLGGFLGVFPIYSLSSS